MACVVVGLGMTIGSGFVAVDSVLDYRAFPRTPTPVTVAQLAAMTSVPRGAWVSVIDGQPDCRRGYARPHDTAYALVGDGKSSAVIVVALNEPPACERLTRTELTGVPSLRRTVEAAPGRDLPDGLAWPGVAWQVWPGHHAVILWTWSGPKDSRTGIWLGAAFAALGVFVTWYGVRSLRPPVPDAAVMDPSRFPGTVQLTRRAGSTLPATVVWLPVVRTEVVTTRGLATGVTLYELELPPIVNPLSTRRQHTLSSHTGPGVAGLIFRSTAREAVAAARPAGSEDFVLIRSDLAELELSKASRAALFTGHLRNIPSPPS
jgi:hypothetical protein